MADLGERVLQPDHALAHPLDLVGEQAVLPLQRATARDADPARQHRAAQDDDQQREDAAEPDQELENGLRYLHRPGRARAVGHQHDRPATLRLFRQCRLR